MEKEHNQWCEITGIKAGDKVCVIAPYPNWSIRDEHVGETFVVEKTHHRHSGTSAPPLCVLVERFGGGLHGCIPFWCLVKVEDKND